MRFAAISAALAIALPSMGQTIIPTLLPDFSLSIVRTDQPGAPCLNNKAQHQDNAPVCVTVASNDGDLLALDRSGFLTVNDKESQLVFEAKPQANLVWKYTQLSLAPGTYSGLCLGPNGTETCDYGPRWFTDSNRNVVPLAAGSENSVDALKAFGLTVSSM